MENGNMIGVVIMYNFIGFNSRNTSSIVHSIVLPGAQWNETLQHNLEVRIKNYKNIAAVHK